MGLFGPLERRVSLLTVDPGLGRKLKPAERPAVARAAQARVLTLDAGHWTPQSDGAGTGALGMLVIDGVLCRSVMIGHEGSDTVMGKGDVLYPWSESIGSELLPAHVMWDVLAPARVAVLDRSLIRALAPWPDLTAELFRRYSEWSRTQAALTATAHVKRVDIRLLAVLWHLAERFGRVTPEGVVVPIRLTHIRLARMVGAQRPSVTTALTRMLRDGRLVQTNGHFILAQHSITTLDTFADTAGVRHASAS